MNAPRLRTWLLAIFTAVLATLGNAAIAVNTGFEVFSFTMFFLIPVGTLLLCVVASSGFYLGARTSPFQPTQIDLAFLMLVNVGLIVLVYAAEFLYAIATHDSPAGQAATLPRFIADRVTQAKYHTYMRGMPANAPPVSPGEAGWLLLLIRVSAALAVAKIVHSSFDRRGAAIRHAGR